MRSHVRCLLPLLGAVSVLLACPAGAEPSRARPAAPPSALSWSPDTRSPRPTATPQGLEAALYPECGEPDLGLVRVAAAVVARRLAGQSPLSDSQLKERARAAGVPHPWPRAWLLRGNHTVGETAARMGRWLDAQPLRGTRRCGIARGAGADGTPVLAVVSVDALADQAELPRRVRVSQWLALTAELPGASDAKVVLLGPRGRPRTVLSSLSYDSGTLRSRFTLDKPGRWLVQVIADVGGGPTPVLESVVFADVEPPASLPDETAGRDRDPPSAPALLSLLNRARRREGLKPLTRDPALESLALAHARAMVLSGRVAHDVGAGLPSERVSAAGIQAARVGENVATAGTVRRIHQVLWDSPSHRENLLDPGFARVGVALVRDQRDRLWAVQLFTP